MVKEFDIEYCSICFLRLDHDVEAQDGWVFGCNADPINDGQCCNTCDETIVLTARLNQLSPAFSDHPKLFSKGVQPYKTHSMNDGVSIGGRLKITATEWIMKYTPIELYRTRHGVWYEHPIHGDESPLMLVHDGRVYDTDIWEYSDIALELI